MQTSQRNIIKIKSLGQHNGVPTTGCYLLIGVFLCIIQHFDCPISGTQHFRFNIRFQWRSYSAYCNLLIFCKWPGVKKTYLFVDVPCHRYTPGCSTSANFYTGSRQNNMKRKDQKIFPPVCIYSSMEKCIPFK